MRGVYERVVYGEGCESVRESVRGSSAYKSAVYGSALYTVYYTLISSLGSTGPALLDV
jgi:hypothetical protein